MARQTDTGSEAAPEPPDCLPEPTQAEQLEQLRHQLGRVEELLEETRERVDQDLRWLSQRVQGAEDVALEVSRQVRDELGKKAS